MNNRSKKITIGIAFYNAERFLSDAIRSVLNQTYENIELILLDDGSTDGSLSIARSFDDNRIRLVKDGVNKGLGARLNEMADMAEGEFFARMDADDIMHYNRLEKQMTYLEEHPDVDVVGSHAYNIAADNTVTGEICYAMNPDSKEHVIAHRCFIHPTIMSHTKWFRDNKYDADAIRMEDYDLWMRTIETNRFANIPEHLLYYRTTGLPYLSKYLKSMRGERSVLKRNREKLSHYYIYLVKTYIKGVLYAICWFFGLTDKLISVSRVGHLNVEVLKRAQEDLCISIMKQ